MLAQDFVPDAAANQDFPILFMAAAVLFLILFLLAALVAFMFARDWARAFFSGAGISFADIIGMKLRGSDSKTLIDCRVMSVQAGTPVAMKLLEAAHLSGADVRKVTMAYVDAKKSGKEFSFEELVDANRSDRLSEILNVKRTI